MSYEYSYFGRFYNIELTEDTTVSCFVQLLLLYKSNRLLTFTSSDPLRAEELYQVGFCEARRGTTRHHDRIHNAFPAYLFAEFATLLPYSNTNMLIVTR